jgi:hypothetical protein
MSTRGRLHDRRKRCLFSTAQPAGCERLPGWVKGRSCAVGELTKEALSRLFTTISFSPTADLCRPRKGMWCGVSCRRYCNSMRSIAVPTFRKRANKIMIADALYRDGRAPSDTVQRLWPQPEEVQIEPRRMVPCFTAGRDQATPTTGRHLALSASNKVAPRSDGHRGAVICALCAQPAHTLAHRQNMRVENGSTTL